MGGARTGTPVDQWSAASAVLESRARQQAVWRMLLNYRYLAILGTALLAMTPAAGEHHWGVALIALVLVIPYNAAWDLYMRRTGVLPSTVAYTDQIVAVALLAYAPELAVALMLVFLAIDATSAVAFGRRVAAQSAIIGAIGVGLVLLWRQPDNAVPAYLVSLVAGGFIVVVVGGMSEVERTVRQRYAELMGGIDAVVWEQLTRNPSTLYVNHRAEEILGHPVSAWAEPGFWGRTVHPDDKSEAARTYRTAIRRGENCELEYRMLAADGSVVHVHDRMRVSTDGDGRVARVRGVLLDITEQRLAEEQANQLYNLVQRIQLALFVFRLADPDVDSSLTVLAVNPEAALLTGSDVDQWIGRPMVEVMSTDAHLDLVHDLAHVVRTGQGMVFEDFRLDPNDPNGRVYSAHAFPLPGNAVGFSLQDITERAVAAEVLRRQALHDGLTGLPNRTQLNDRLRHALQVGSESGQSVALLVMDLDQFKEVNDALGHDHGDRLLIEMSRRLQRVLREVDTIARLGGDEFAVLLTSNADPSRARAVARRIREALDQPFQLGGISLQTSASVGIALAPDHAGDAETLVQRADVAMYTAKRGGGGVAVYAPEHDQSSVRRLTLLGELRRAIAEDELVLHYQPVVDLHTGEVGGVEALVRWQHPEFGLMLPGDFIELAEVSGTIHALTHWVIEEALAQACTWHGQGIGVTVSVNLSVRNLYEPDLVNWLGDLLQGLGAPPGVLQLEITESELMDDPLLAMDVLGRIQQLGTSTSIDDFGTGYSSLSYLKNLPIDQLKIDRSFVATMAHDESDLTIVRSTIDLSHNLGLGVVAEGVEDATTLGMLAALGCDRAQGFHIGHPLPADELTRWWRAPDGRAQVLSGLPHASGVGFPGRLTPG